MPVITAKDLYKCYAGFSPVLRGASLDVESGEMVAIMGPSGCGKSTMLHILGLLHAPDSGSLEILGKDVLQLNREQTAAFRRENLGFVMQSSNLFDHSTVFENVEFPLIYDNVPPQERWERVIRALELVRLSSRVHYRSNRLSGGEQQRVAIARAMVNNPRILFADEPTGALDERTSVLIMENFRTLCHSGGVSMVMVTHDPKMAGYCDSIYTLEEGMLKRQSRHIPKLHQQTENFLVQPMPKVHGAMLTWAFPPKKEPEILDLANILHSRKLLSKIYALESPIWNSLSGYALPLAVRKIDLANFFSQLLASAKTKSIHSGENACLEGYAFFKRMRLMAYKKILTKWCVQDKIDFCLAAGAGAPAYAACLVSLTTCKGFSVFIQSADFPKLSKNFSVILDNAAFVLCETYAAARKLCELYGVKYNSKISIIHIPLPVLPPSDDTILPPIKDAGSEKGVIRVMVAGNAASGIAFGHILRACASIKAKGKRIRLTVTNAGHHKIPLSFLAIRLGIRKDVKFVKSTTTESLGKYLSESDIFVLPVKKTILKDEIGLPLPLAEAMAFKLAIITADLPGINEAVTNGINGITIPPNDFLAFNDALAFLAESPQRRIEFGENAQKTIFKLFDAESTGQELENIFRAACKDNHRV